MPADADGSPMPASAQPSAAEQTRRELFDAIRDDGQRMAAGLIRLLHAMSAQSDLNPTDFQCFALLRVGGPMTPSEIARSLRMRTGSVTTVIDRLSSRGLVERAPHPDDRRKRVVRLAGTAPTTAAPSPMGLADAMIAMHADYTDAELSVIADWLSRAGTVLTQVAESLGEQKP
ncbi:MarR family winged helix-turn-helix transcriptional regulator [Nocardiopsis coralliicola]